MSNLGAVFHITTNGADTLCCAPGLKIHAAYADRLLDMGQWCESCQRVKRHGGLKPYRFSFITEGRRQFWVRFYRDMEIALSDSKAVALKEFPDAHSFAIESDQNSFEVRKSWGLDF